MCHVCWTAMFFKAPAIKAMMDLHDGLANRGWVEPRNEHIPIFATTYYRVTDFIINLIVDAFYLHMAVHHM